MFCIREKVLGLITLQQNDKPTQIRKIGLLLTERFFVIHLRLSIGGYDKTANLTLNIFLRIDCLLQHAQN